MQTLLPQEKVNLVRRLHEILPKNPTARRMALLETITGLSPVATSLLLTETLLEQVGELDNKEQQQQQQQETTVQD